MSQGQINVAVVDDHTLFRKALVNYLSQQTSLNIVIEVHDAIELLPKLAGISIDVILLDVFAPGINCIEALRTIRKDHPQIKVVVLSMCTDMRLINDLIETGIHGFISKTDEPENLCNAISAAAENRIFRNKLFTEALYWNRQVGIKNGTNGNNVVFAEREKRILQLLWEEKNNKEIADEIFLSVRSVEKIRQDMKEKLAVKSTIGLLKYALMHKIIDNNNQTVVVVP
ncbi:MAG: response regulator transcription factor [Chitinophagaceae bacterium]